MTIAGRCQNPWAYIQLHFFTLQQFGPRVVWNDVMQKAEGGSGGAMDSRNALYHITILS
jgi:hypothetical protein